MPSAAVSLRSAARSCAPLALVALMASEAFAQNGSWCGVDALDQMLRARRPRMHALGGCPPSGACDLPGVRDTTGVDWINLRAIVHAMRASNGSGGVTQPEVDAMIDQINADMRANRTGVQFDRVATRFHDDDIYVCLPACGADCTTFFGTLDYMKVVFAEAPEYHCNVYVSCQGGGLGGVGSPASTMASRPPEPIVCVGRVSPPTASERLLAPTWCASPPANRPCSASGCG
jgi:hypothetical protein